jgi:ATP-dependent Lon protease
MALDLDSRDPRPREPAGEATPSAQPYEAIPEDALIIVPVRRLVVFPGMILPIALGREGSIAAAQAAARERRSIGVVFQRNAEADKPRPEDLSLVGTVATLVRYITTPDGTHHVICQGMQRFRAVEYLDGYPFLVARVARIEEQQADGKEIEARFVQLKQRALEVLELLPQAPADRRCRLRARSPISSAA